MPSRRPASFALLVGAAVLAAAVYVGSAAVGGGSASDAASASAASSLALARQPRVVFRDLDRKDRAEFGRVALASLARPGARRVVTGMECDRVYFAAGRGLCLARIGGFGTFYSAIVFGPQLEMLRTIGLSGVPSRARISPDGRYGAVTTFVAGHSYGTPGKFSTATVLIDMATGHVLANLEQFTITRGGTRIDKPDFNFWGVTFAHDGNRFYATLATGRKTYLVQGDVRKRAARVLHENVECPSLSPDERRIAFKKRVTVVKGSPRIWQLYVLDLATMKERRLAERRAIDDQAEWLDDDHILYGADEDVWVVRADGGGRPHRFLAQAASPAVVRS
jgi:hypothetical protein